MSAMGRIFLLSFLYLLFTDSCFCAVTAKPKSEGFTPAPNISKSSSSLTQKCDPCPKNVPCVPYIQCPAHVQLAAGTHLQLCELPDNSHGYCCTSGQNHTLARNETVRKTRSTDALDPALMRNVIIEARSQFAQLLHQEVNLQPSDGLARGHPEFLHTMVFRSSPQNMKRSIDLSHRAMEHVMASQIYQKKQHISPEEFQLQTFRADLKGTLLEPSCEQMVPCPPPGRYYPVDGMCNNQAPDKSRWGAAGSPMEHLLPPSYEDGIWAPRLHSSVDGSPLTNARTISRQLLQDQHRPHSVNNLLFMQFGQFLAHDVTQTASITLGNGESVNCCTRDGSAPLVGRKAHFACMPIIIESGDYFYSKFNQGCMNFVRSSLSPDNKCSLGYGKQLSKVTHFIDASVIYGSDMAAQAAIRSFSGGKLQVFNDFGRDMLPLSSEPDACNLMGTGNACFQAGDGRVNQIISLTALHTMFMREHNRIASALASINPHWPDHILFEETRRIVIAELQFIVYNEFVPSLIGEENMIKFQLKCQREGYSSDYNPEVNACITAEFTTSAFRFGHSTVDGRFNIRRNGHFSETIVIPDVMFNPSRLRHTPFYDEIMQTMVNQPMQEVDSFITKGLSLFLFRAGNPFGLDLASINIQRGRDHGIRPYNDYLEVSGRQRVTDFNEFGPEIGARLSSVYRHPDDIDLWVGGLLEGAVPGAVVGPTFAEIIADQFSRFRKGDRYFHEHNPDINPGHFSLQQLYEIRKVSLARIICDNSDRISMHEIPPRALQQPSVPGNAPVACDGGSLASINFEAWRE